MTNKVFKNTEGKMLGVFLHDIYKAAVEGLKNKLELHPVPFENYEDKSIKSFHKTAVFTIQMNDGSIVTGYDYIDFANKLLAAVLEGKFVAGDDNLEMKFVKSLPSVFSSHFHKYYVEVKEVDKTPTIVTKASEKPSEKSSNEVVPKSKKTKKVVVEASGEV